MGIEKDINIRKGARVVFQLEEENSSFDPVQRVLAMEVELGQGAIGSGAVEKHKYRFSSRSRQSG